MGDSLKLLLLVVAVFAVYLGHCRLWPFAACWKCKGEAKFRSPTGWAFRLCPRCDGLGMRKRVGWYVLNYLSKKRGT